MLVRGTLVMKGDLKLSFYGPRVVLESVPQQL